MTENDTQEERTPVETPSTDPADIYWTPKRRELRKWLTINAPALAPVYLAAVQMAMDDSFPGRVWFVAHAIREIRNRLPDALAGAVTSSRTEYSVLAEEVFSYWIEDGFPKDGTLRVDDGSDPTASGPKKFEISLQLITAVSNLIEGHLAVSDRKQNNARRLFEVIAGEPVPQYVIKAWLRSSKWADEYAHVRIKPLKTADESSLITYFMAFENALLAISNRSYENMDDLDEILGSTNR